MSGAAPSDQDVPAAGEVEGSAVTDSAPAGAGTGDSGPDGEGEGPKSMLEAVMSNFETSIDGAPKDGTEAPPASSEPEPKSDSAGTAEKPLSPAEAAAKEVADSDYVPPEEWKQFGPKARKRIDRLRGVNRELKQEIEEFRPIQETVRSFDFSKEDVEISFGLMKTLKRGDYETFLAGIEPYVELCKEALGHKLPQDLQQHVDDGLTTAEIASELAKTRFKAASAEARAETTQQHVTHQEAVRAAEQIRGSIAEWEGQIKLRDPDYSRKAGEVQRVAALLVERHGRPTSVQGALDLAKAAYEEVNRIAASLAPANARATRPTPNGSARSSGNLRSEPKSMLEAIEQGLQRA